MHVTNDECTSSRTHQSKHAINMLFTNFLEYGYGCIAVVIICIASMVGILIVPCLAYSIYTNMLTLMIGLAIGTLISDATLHLIPEVRIVSTHFLQ